MKTKLFFLALLSVTFFSCEEVEQNEIPIGGIENSEAEYISWYKSEISNYLSGDCSKSGVEFIDLYTIADTIPEDGFENLILVDSLRNRGYDIATYGRGNWVYGPRIVSYTLTNGNCTCKVDKLYRAVEQKSFLKITERINCEELTTEKDSIK